jgi:hypothetical protein
MKLAIRMLAALFGIGTLTAAMPTAAAGEKSARTGPLASLPTPPGPHIDKIKALADNAWIPLGAPASDPKWGKARGRSWGSVFPYAPELNAAFLCGEGIHGWYNKQTNRYMDDLWACKRPSPKGDGFGTRKPLTEDVLPASFGTGLRAVQALGG